MNYNNSPGKENHTGEKKNQTQRELPWADLDAGDKFLTISRGRALIYSDQ